MQFGVAGSVVNTFFMCLTAKRVKLFMNYPTCRSGRKTFVNKQITPRKFMIRQIRGAAKKVGDRV